MSKKLRTLLIFAAPLLVGILNIFHPLTHEGTPIYETVRPVVTWWIDLHVLNLFGFALLGLAAYLLILDWHGPAAVVAKAALIVFVPAYVGFDAIIGIGTGNLVQYATRLAPSLLVNFEPGIEAFWNNGTSARLAVIGSAAWSVAMSAAAVSLARERRVPAIILAVMAGTFTGWGHASGMDGTLPWWTGVLAMAVLSMAIVRPALPFALLLLAGILFGTSHVVPFGPLGMVCFLAEVSLLQFAPQQSRYEEHEPRGNLRPANE